MPAAPSVLDELDDVPGDAPVEELDVGDLPPPEPMTETLERLTELSTDAVLLQRNDRAPEFLFPKLDDRGFDYETIELGQGVYTAIWHAER
jgi:hypothetical protein